MARSMFTLLLLFAVASASPAPLMADDGLVRQIRQQLPLWIADDKARFEGPEIREVQLDLKLYDDATDSVTRDALEDMLLDDWLALDAVDDILDKMRLI